MVERVFLHIGQPKTGTTYLQGILWENRERLRGEGVVLPGRGHREHLWAALDVQQRKHLERRDPRAPGSWERLCAEMDTESGTGLVTHEFLCGAGAGQVRRAVRRLAPAEVHVVVTARHTAGMLTAGWQEMVKNGSQKQIREVAEAQNRSEFGWRTWDLAGVLERWSRAVPPERVHVLPVPGRGEPPDRHWRNFAGVLGLTGDYPLPDRPANPSLGAVQVELLRRVNAHLGAFHTALDRGEWIRGFLAERNLGAQQGERFGLDDDLLADCRARSRRAVDLIVERGFHVVGDVEQLLVPDDLPPGRALASVTDGEMLAVATELVGTLMEDVRDLSDRLRRDGGTPGGATRSTLRRAVGTVLGRRGEDPAK
ncbi:hypothetical protein [Nocardioides lianchengensis]|uniref:Sulfotransferase family protein n=1 Tax=Nocardioides lianchengensis TaxID=1045774 RepID=A0A1G6K238_9ACTN|nr:hypothetical protein [Nocardioides lianchengensis]NYG08839.1 hypothetical protein [Nocardioides lianchengensis]SDC24356.1 hypothetical protein SAMN05421872_101641 [Nocardioides lianchengensis]